MVHIIRASATLVRNRNSSAFGRDDVAEKAGAESKFRQDQSTQDVPQAGLLYVRSFVLDRTAEKIMLMFLAAV